MQVAICIGTSMYRVKLSTVLLLIIMQAGKDISTVAERYFLFAPQVLFMNTEEHATGQWSKLSSV